jgi:small subunit ribosomal protein S11
MKKIFNNKFAIVIIKITNNNIFITITSKNGNVLYWSSCGSCGFKGPRRVTGLAAEVLGSVILKKLIFLKIKTIDLKIYSYLNIRVKSVLKSLLYNSLLFIKSINLEIPVSHNGIRFKKLRRV